MPEAPNIATLIYEAPGRRVSKAIDNSAHRDDTYHYCYNGQAPTGRAGQVIETRNGSDWTLKQHVWGVTYVDELLQTLEALLGRRFLTGPPPPCGPGEFVERIEKLLGRPLAPQKRGRKPKRKKQNA